MRAGGGAPKGAEFERYVSKRFSLWISKGRRDDLLWRTAMSGGRATFQLRKDIVNRAQAGDLTAIAEEAYALCEKCVFEAKFYKTLDLSSFLTKAGGKLAGFWNAARKTAQRLGKEPVLVAKQNRFPVLLLTRCDCAIFPTAPIAVMPRLGVEIRLFEEATFMIRRRSIRSREEVADAR